MKFRVYSKTKIKGGYDDMLHAEDYFVSDEFVSKCRTDLDLQITFTTADGNPIPEGYYRTAWYYYGMESLTSSRVTYFVNKKWFDKDPSYVNECIKHLVETANGFLAFHPDWFATFRMDEAKRFWL